MVLTVAPALLVVVVVGSAGDNGTCVRLIGYGRDDDSGVILFFVVVVVVVAVVDLLLLLEELLGCYWRCLDWW